MSLESRLRQLEKHTFGKHGGRCPLCRGYGKGPSIYNAESDKDPRPDVTCPQCGAVPGTVIRVIFEERPSDVEDCDAER